MKLTERGKQTLKKNKETFLDGFIFGANDGIEIFGYILFIVIPIVFGVMMCFGNIVALIPVGILFILFGILMLIVAIGANINYYFEPNIKEPKEKQPKERKLSYRTNRFVTNKSTQTQENLKK